MDLVDDEPPDGGKDSPSIAGEAQIERLRRGYEHVGRMALHRAALLGRRLYCANGGGDVGHDAPGDLDLVADADERRAQVAVDVMGEGLQRRYIKDATSLGFGGRRFRREAVEAPEEGGESLPAACGRGHEHVAAGSHLAPTALLDRGRVREGGPKPVPGRRRKEVENVPHASKFDGFRLYKQVFVNRILGMSHALRVKLCSTHGAPLPVREARRRVEADPRGCSARS